jgi:hypothetical protein
MKRHSGAAEQAKQAAIMLIAGSLTWAIHTNPF